MSETHETVQIGRFLTVSEIFGPTLQGEGCSAGVPALFVRLGLCNLDCKWCDTPYTWDWTGKNGFAYSRNIELRRMSVDAVFDRIKGSAAPQLVVVSGGEPMLQQRSLLDLARRLVANGHRVEVETNGTIMPDDAWEMLTERCDVQFNVSPKLANSGVSEVDAIKQEPLRRYVELRAVFKFVVQSPLCVRQVNDVVELARVPPHDVYLMPEGRTAAELLDRLPNVFEDCVLYGYNLTPRLQVLTYGAQRGV